jgi:hypothetical protein
MAELFGERRAGRSVCDRAPGISTVHDDVGGACQFGQPLAMGGVVRIKHRTALVGVVDAEPDARALDEGQRVACDAAARRFDLQHVGAQIGQQPADAVGFRAAKIQHPQGCEQSPVHVASSLSAHSRCESVSVAT